MALIAAELEGVIDQVEKQGVNAKLVVMGVTVIVEKAVADNGRVKTPTKKLSIDDLTNEAAFPGMTAKGFIGGTAIVTGNFNTVTNVLEVKFNPTNPLPNGGPPFELNPLLEVGPPENLVSGPVTQKVDAGGFKVNGVAVELIPATEPRLPGEPPSNEFGFEVVPSSIALETLASVDGYLSADKTKFFGYNFVIDGPAVLTKSEPQLSILRTRVRDRGGLYDLDIRGAVTLAHVTDNRDQTIEIHRIDPDLDASGNTQLDASGQVKTKDSLIGLAIARFRPGGFANWSFNETPTSPPPPLSPVPTKFVAVNVSPGASGARDETDDIDAR